MVECGNTNVYVVTLVMAGFILLIGGLGAWRIQKLRRQISGLKGKVHSLEQQLMKK